MAGPSRIAGLRWTGSGQPCNGGAVLLGFRRDGWPFGSWGQRYPWSDAFVGFRQERRPSAWTLGGVSGRASRDFANRGVSASISVGTTVPRSFGATVEPVDDRSPSPLTASSRWLRLCISPSRARRSNGRRSQQDSELWYRRTCLQTLTGQHIGVPRLKIRPGRCPGCGREYSLKHLLRHVIAGETPHRPASRHRLVDVQ